MSEISYWERRQAETMYEYMEEVEKAADEIAQLYLKASRYFSSQADDIFEKYQTKYGLTENEARRLLNELRDKTSLDELLEKLRNGNSDMSRQELLKQLESPAYQARLERLRQLQNQLDFVMTQIYNQEKQKNTSFYTDLGNEAYYKSMFNIQQQAGLAFSFSAIDPQTIDQVVHSKWSGKNYSERIWKNTKALAQDIKEQLLLGVVTGKTNREISGEIESKYAVGAAVARRLVRTESNYVATEINFKAYEEAEIEKYRFCSVLDLRTSQICRSLDRKVFLVKDRKTGVNSPPMHPWCRSTTIAVISEELLNKMTRRARDPVTGKVLMIPANVSYQEWYDKYVKGRPEAELAEKQIKNRTADQKQWEKYREILGEEMPDSLDKFQKMKYNKNEKWEDLKSKKQQALNKMDFSDMERLKGKLGNKEVRQWYKAHDEKIPDLLDKTLSLEKRARQACELRNQYRTQARELMKDQTARKELDMKHKNPTFDELLEYKRKKYGLSESEAYEDIIRSSTTTNKKYDKIAGIEGKEDKS